MEIRNRKARFNYEITDSMEAGIVLVGSEVKSIRAGKADIKDSYAIIKNNECWLLNMYIANYQNSSFNPDENRSRKLLLKKKQIKKLESLVNADGYTLIPLKLYFKNNKAKLELGIGKGKKLYDKRETIKQRDIDRNIQANLKY
jgi:SsrA-binding protein